MTAPHPDSVVPRPDGGSVTLKVHRAIWSGVARAQSDDRGYLGAASAGIFVPAGAG